MDLRIAKKYQERFYKIEAAYGLIDDCKYMLYFADGWALGDYPAVPVRTKKEAIEYIKSANKYDWRNNK